MAHLTLELLGEFRISCDRDAEISLPGKRAQALLAYLALNSDQRHTRGNLATLLWADRFEEQGRQSLRQCVRTLRRALGDEYASLVVSEGDRLTLNLEPVEIDVRSFERVANENTRD